VGQGGGRDSALCLMWCHQKEFPMNAGPPHVKAFPTKGARSNGARVNGVSWGLCMNQSGAVTGRPEHEWQVESTEQGSGASYARNGQPPCSKRQVERVT
jgi:hypothetical protein